jgi:heme exporter protein B
MKNEVTAPLVAARLVAMRDLRLAFRKPSQVIQPLMFFMIVATLFPLTLTPEMSRLRDAAPGVLWIGALHPRCWRSSSCSAMTR